LLEEITEQLDFSDQPVRLDNELIAHLFADALSKQWENDQTDHYRLDRWLAPRLHAAIRVPRRLAADRAFWAWIAMSFGAPYIHQRFQRDGVVNSWRFTGELLRNGVSRLWWAAELLRNGPDYADVDRGLRRVRTAEFALELKYSWYRPAAIAFVRVAEGSRPPLKDDELEALSRRANAYLPLAPLEAIGFDDPADVPDREWWMSQTTLAELNGDADPKGPKDGHAGSDAIDAIEKWYGEVLAEHRATSDFGVTMTEGSASSAKRKEH
jgi:hypothetical protein